MRTFVTFIYMIEIVLSAFLFDMDGVLIDSTPAVARVWSQWALEHEFDPEDVVRRAHGRPSLTTVRELLPDSNHEAENLEIERREIEDLDGVIPLPGALELLNALPPDRWAIVTSCTAPLAKVRMRAASLPVPRFLVTADDVRIGKPDPEPYMKGASLLGYPTAKCVVVEDVPAGIRAGKSAGARVLALRTTSSAAELSLAAPDWIASNCAGISLRRVESTGLTVAIDE